MCPNLSVDNSTNNIRANAETSGKSHFSPAVGHICMQYFKNLSIGEFGITDLLTVKVPTFSNFIGSIILVSTQKEMVGSNTGWIVAFMANKLVFWNRAVSKLIGNSMSKANLVVADAKPTIAATVEVSSPKPTGFGFLNVTKETRSNILPLQIPVELAGTGMAAEPAIATPYIGAKSKELFTAIFASFGNSCGIMGMHGNSPFRVIPLATGHSAGAFCC